MHGTDARDISALCRKLGIRVIPLFQCLGHQGWGGSPNSILRRYPEFDETPHVPLDAKWPDFFCRSWCPLHPGVNALVFDLMDDIIDAFEADAFHVGMDEVFALADDGCPRCQGKPRAELFAKAVNDYYGYLKRRNVDMFMWGDRLNDSAKTGYNEWEGDTFGTHAAIDAIPRDITILDWHYEKLDAYPSVGIFLRKGFTVWPCCWFKTEAALHFLAESRRIAEALGAEERMPGMVVTSWNHWSREAFESCIMNTAAPEKEIDELYVTLDAVIGMLRSREEDGGGYEDVPLIS